MNTIKQLRENRASIWEKMEGIMALAQTEERDLTDDERTEYDTHEVDYKAASDALAHAEKRERARLQASKVDWSDGSSGDDTKPAASPRSLGEQFVAEVGQKLLATHSADSRWSVAHDFKAAATDTINTGTGDLSQVLTEVDTTVVEGFRRRLMVRDLLTPGTTTAQAITYFIEGAMEGNFATVAENAQKPQLNFINPTPVTDAVKKIAGFIKESDEMIEDLPFLVSAINTRLLYQLDLFEENQVLNGNGTGTNLRGLLQRSGIQSVGAVGDAAADNADQLFNAKTLVSTATGLEADGLIINPVDYQTLRLSKDGNDQYYGGGFFTGPYGNGGIQEDPPIWGLRTVVTPAIAAGTVAVGAFRQSSTLYSKGGTRVEATNSNEDDFTNNRVTIRAEKRRALAVRVPSALVKVTLGAA